MGDRGHNRHGQKEGAGCCAPFMGDLGPHLTKRRWAEALLRTKCHLDPSIGPLSVCPVCLSVCLPVFSGTLNPTHFTSSVTLVYCSQTVGSIKMKIVIEDWR